MLLDELPDAEKTCDNCAQFETAADCVECTRYRHPWADATDQWSESMNYYAVRADVALAEKYAEITALRQSLAIMKDVTAQDIAHERERIEKLQVHVDSLAGRKPT